MRSTKIENVSCDLIEASLNRYKVSGKIVSDKDSAMLIQFVRGEKIKIEDSGKRIFQDASETILFEETLLGGVSPFSFSADASPSMSVNEQDALGKVYQLDISYYLVCIDLSLNEEVAKTSLYLEGVAIYPRSKISLAEKLVISSGFCCCIGEQTDFINVLVNSESDSSETGKPFTLFLEVYNYATQAVKSVEVKLSREILAGSNEIYDIITKLDFNGVKPDKYIPSFPVNLQVPSQAIPTADFSKFKCSYFVDVAAILQNSSDVRFRISVRVFPLRNQSIPRALRKSG